MQWASSLEIVNDVFVLNITSINLNNVDYDQWNKRKIHIVELKNILYYHSQPAHR